MTALIVGNCADLHVQAVLKSIQESGYSYPVLIDAEVLSYGNYSLTRTQLEIGEYVLDVNDTDCGWLRRYAPSNWGAGIVTGSLDAVIYRSFLTLVGCVSRMGRRTWLTEVDDMLRAEDRLLQLKFAEDQGIMIPRTIVVGSAEQAIDELGERFIVKPLSLGYFSTESGPRAVYTNVVNSIEALDIDFSGAPFMAQELIEAQYHYRVVTVKEKAWVCKLSADDRPVDWRQQARAHHEWEVAEDQECAELAIQLARSFSTGYTSQDWLVMGDKKIFIDLNPGGQWLFLPEPVSSEVTEAIAMFLGGNG